MVALALGVFKRLKFMGLGLQIDVCAEQMTNSQMGLFCIVGAVATFVSAWVLVLFSKRICASRSEVFKSVMWYVTLALLLIDPLYMSVLCGLFGGGDMNGIRLLMPEVTARALFGIIGVAHIVVIWKKLLPTYTQAFKQ